MLILNSKFDIEPIVNNQLKRFSLDLAEIESAIVAHKINDGVKLLVYEVCVVTDYWYTDDSTGLVVLMVNFGNWDIEPAPQSAD